MNSKEIIKEEVLKLTRKGDLIFGRWVKRDGENSHGEYQEWYTPALRIITQFLPERLREFKAYYEIDMSRKEITLDKFVIQDFFIGIVAVSPQTRIIDPFRQASICMLQQQSILKSLYINLDTVLFNVESTILMEYQEDELEAAKTVLDVNIRAAGALCGVVIEKHLKRLSEKNDLQPDKKNPGINWYSSKLREKSIITVGQKKKIDYMADIRNRCDHPDDEEPTREEVMNLIGDTEWLIKSVI